MQNGGRCPFLIAGNLYITTIMKITICNFVTIGAGAVVVKDITEAGTYVRNPSKLIKT